MILIIEKTSGSVLNLPKPVSSYAVNKKKKETPDTPFKSVLDAETQKMEEEER